MEKQIKEILNAKEKRANARLKIANEGSISVSLTINVPGIPKSNDLIHHFFLECLSDLKRFLISHRISVDIQHELIRSDAAGDFYLVPMLDLSLQADVVKKLSEIFESEHPLGRLLDVDITDEDGNPVSSGKEKACYFCGEHSAVFCMRMKSHSYEEMRSIMENDIADFLSDKKRNKVCKDLSVFALKALLHEVALSPKPGLVDRFCNGSHTDMDFASFLNSSAVLSVYFKEIAEYGYDFSSTDIKSALPKLRQIGLQMESDMFEETNGVNTHKGAIFLLGFSLFVCAFQIKSDNFSHPSFVNQIKELNGDLVEKELGKNLYAQNKTHGEVCYEKFGKKGQGIRGEIQAGLPCVFQHAIPVLNEQFDTLKYPTDKEIQVGLSRTLLVLIANNDDSNILYRKGEEVLNELKILAQEAFNAFTQNAFDSKYESLIRYCDDNQISPGGSADLLAVSYYIYMVSKKYYTKD